MYNNNLNVVPIQVTKDNPFSMVVPKGYVKIIHHSQVIPFFKEDIVRIYEEGSEITLDRGKYLMTTIKLDEELEFNKLIDIQFRGSLRAKSKSFLMIIRGNFTSASVLACKVHQSYDCNDPGFFSEYEQSIDRTLNRINTIINDLSDTNINKVKELIQNSVSLVAKKYGIANLKVIFESFE